MKTMKQVDATVSIIMSVLEEKGISYTLGGPTFVKEYFDVFKDETYKRLIAGFKAGEIDLSEDAREKFDWSKDDKKLRSYVVGLVNNHVRKYSGFIAGGKHEPANPGSRSGSTDGQVKNMRLLLKKPGLSEESKALIQAQIEARLAEIKPETKVEINAEFIPEEFRHLLD